MRQLKRNTDLPLVGSICSIIISDTKPMSLIQGDGILLLLFSFGFPNENSVPSVISRCEIENEGQDVFTN